MVSATFTYRFHTSTEIEFTLRAPERVSWVHWTRHLCFPHSLAAIVFGVVVVVEVWKNRKWDIRQ